MKNSKKDEKVCVLIDKLIEIRKEKGLTQSNLAERSSNSQQVISRIESKTSIPQLNTFCELLDILGYKVEVQAKNVRKNIIKLDENIIQDIELNDIPNDYVITYSKLKVDGSYDARDIRDIEWYTKPNNIDIVDMDEINYSRVMILNSLLEFKAMLESDKISKKRLERIKEDLECSKEIFEETLSEIDYIANFIFDPIIEKIDDFFDIDC